MTAPDPCTGLDRASTKHHNSIRSLRCECWGCCRMIQFSLALQVNLILLKAWDLLPATCLRPQCPSSLLPFVFQSITLFSPHTALAPRLPTQPEKMGDIHKAAWRAPAQHSSITLTQGRCMWVEAGLGGYCRYCSTAAVRFLCCLI